MIHLSEDTKDYRQDSDGYYHCTPARPHKRSWCDGSPPPPVYQDGEDACEGYVQGRVAVTYTDVAKQGRGLVTIWKEAGGGAVIEVGSQRYQFWECTDPFTGHTMTVDRKGQAACALYTLLERHNAVVYPPTNLCNGAE